MVGTVDYIAPEVFGSEGYTETVDFWSLGTILFEMLLGYAPFYGDNPRAALKNVMNFEKSFQIPSDANISPESIDLMRKLIRRADDRLGKNGVSEIKAHPFFKGINWKNIRNQKAPIVQHLSNEEDTKNFESFEMKNEWVPVFLKNSEMPQAERIPFIGYTYKKPIDQNQANEIEELLENIKRKKENERKNNFSEERISRIQKNQSSATKLESNSKIFDSENKPKFNFFKKPQANEYHEKMTKPKILEILEKRSAMANDEKSGIRHTKMEQKKNFVLSNNIASSKVLERLKVTGRETEFVPKSFQKMSKLNMLSIGKPSTQLQTQTVLNMKKLTNLTPVQLTDSNNKKIQPFLGGLKQTVNVNPVKVGNTLNNNKNGITQMDALKLKLVRPGEKTVFKLASNFGKNLFSGKKNN